MKAGTMKKTKSSQLTDKQRVDRFWMLRRNYNQRQTHGFARDVRALERHVRKLETIVPAETVYGHTIYSRCQDELATLKKWLELAKVWG